MVQVPAALSVAVTPETVQTAGVVEAKLAGKPELADAERVRVRPAVCGGIAPKAMLWATWFTAKLCETGVAGAYCALPVCVA